MSSFLYIFLEIQTNGPGGIGTTSQNASNRSEILYMSAILGRLTNQPADQVLGLLNEAVDAHFKYALDSESCEIDLHIQNVLSFQMCERDDFWK